MPPPSAGRGGTTTGSRRRSGALDVLSSRERDVLAGLVRGLTNKQAGLLLGISHRTVEIHRARLMRKLGAATLSQLLEIAFLHRAELPDI